MQKFWLWFFVILVTITGFTFLNFKRDRKLFSDTTPSSLSISFVEIPNVARVGQRTKISWRVDAPKDFETTNTTIFYSQVSSPSALTKYDSPDSVKYQFSSSDYQNGHFNLPDTFDTYLVFPKAGEYHLRGYSLVRNNHLWTDEQKVIVTP